MTNTTREPYHAVEKPAPAGAPLFFVFHGTGGDEHQFFGLAQELRPDAHVIAPRGDVTEHGALRYFRRKAEGVYDMEDLVERTAKMADFIRERRTALGAPRVLTLGYSNGANILAAVMLHAPELVDDAVLLHPLIPWVPAPQPGLQGKRVLITAGRRDPLCAPGLTHAFADYAAAQGAAMELVWHDGGHELRPGEIEAASRFLQEA
jgi:phospholipase/carboxylesterase